MREQERERGETKKGRTAEKRGRELGNSEIRLGLFLVYILRGIRSGRLTVENKFIYPRPKPTRPVWTKLYPNKPKTLLNSPGSG